MFAPRVAAMFDALRDQVVSVLQEQEQQGHQVAELQKQLADQTANAQALDSELQELRELTAGCNSHVEMQAEETVTPPLQTALGLRVWMRKPRFGATVHCHGHYQFSAETPVCPRSRS